MMFDKSGNLYGTTVGINGGADSGIFRLPPPPPTQAGPWTFHFRHTFSFDYIANGLVPVSPFVFDNDGDIYGVTYGGWIVVSRGGSSVTLKFMPNPVATNVSIDSDGSQSIACGARSEG